MYLGIYAIPNLENNTLLYTYNLFATNLEILFFRQEQQTH